ncbi:MAG: sugar phosphate isomerase/epimerase family protein [Candidatus Omnitrophota bacterium]
MREIIRRIAVLLMLGAALPLVYLSPAAEAQPLCKELYVGGFLIGPQAYSFNRFSFFEAIDKAVQAGCHVIEAYPGQRLSPDDNTPFSHDAPPSVWAKTKIKLERAGIRLVNYGVVALGNDEGADRKVFDFAKVMGIPTITTEPEEGSLELIEKLVKEYDIKIAIHNHPIQPNNPNYKYWDPYYVLNLIQGLDYRIGVCADTGHWARSGVQPLEALRVLEGRIISSHLKDMNEFGVEEAHDVHFGEGVCNMEQMLDELKRQGFQGNISLEYEYNWNNNVTDIAACVEYIRAYGEKH